MAIEVGNYISKELKIYIEQFTSVSEYRDIAENHNLSIETVRAVARRVARINETNRPVLLEVVKLAITNRSKIHQRLLLGHRQAKQLSKVVA